jgi:plastocyanin
MKRIFLLFSLLILAYVSGFSVTHRVTDLGQTFSPDSISINSGDTVEFDLDGSHNAVEVSLATYNANGITSNGGFSLPNGGGKVKLTTLGVHYVVCQPHAAAGMKMRIVVLGTTGNKPTAENSDFTVFPIPANEQVTVEFTLRNQAFVTIDLIDLSGKIVANILSNLEMSGVHKKTYFLDKSTKPGIYFVRMQSDHSNTVVKQISIR